MPAIICTQGLTKNFYGLVAVNQVNFYVEEGETTGLIGPNGSGKTTLFNLLSGYFPASAGRVNFRGQDVTALQPHVRAAMGMARTFQLVSVFGSLTVWENLALSSIRFKQEEHSLGNFYFRPAQRKEVLEACRQALAAVNLESKAGHKTVELSYGDKRMLELAMALSLRPKLLLLDEPLSGLSDHEVAEVVELLQRVRKDFSLVIIEHKISKIIDLADRLCVMNEGCIICEGKPSQVLSDGRVRECYWGKEA